MSKQAPVSFEKPPVIETVLGVQFMRLPGLNDSHLAAFWKSLGDDWQDIDVAPPLEEQIEVFDESARWQAAQLKIMQNPSFRFRMKNKDGNRMLQIQNGRFIYNWLGESGEEYPRYKDAIRPGFDDFFDRFKSFVTSHEIGHIEPNQWEVTYVNHLLKGTVWDKPQDWIGLFKGIPGPFMNTASASLESFQGNWRYEIPPKLGRLHVEVQHGRAGMGSSEGREALVLKLTARGAITEELDLSAGLDRGREVIVTSFRDMMSPEARKQWGEMK